MTTEPIRNHSSRAAGLPAGFTPHQLRHGFASTLLPAGVALTDVARWMGDEPRTVASVYAHLMPGQTERTLALLEQDYQVGTATIIAALGGSWSPSRSHTALPHHVSFTAGLRGAGAVARWRPARRG
jgi:hypothetical protein